MNSGGRFYVYSGGTTIGTSISGSEYVYSGAALATTVLKGGDYLYSGGTASGTLIEGGSEFVSGGTTTNATVFTGAREQIFTGGTAIGTVVSAGNMYVYSGGLASNTLIIGGFEFVYSGGTINGTTVDPHEKITVSVGGTVLGGIVLSGGSAVISGTVAAGQAIVFVNSGGDLLLNNTPAFQAVISGFGIGDKVDLTSFAFLSGTTDNYVEAASNTSGTLTVADGGNQVQLNFIGYYGTAEFQLGNDSNGGTAVKFV